MHNRVHVATMVAIFFALGVGIVIGAALSGGSTRIEEEWIQSIEREMGFLRHERESLAARVLQMEHARNELLLISDTLVDSLVSGVWSGKEAGILMTVEAEDVVASIENLIEHLGGKVTKKLLPEQILNGSMFQPSVDPGDYPVFILFQEAMDEVLPTESLSRAVTIMLDMGYTQLIMLSPGECPRQVAASLVHAHCLSHIDTPFGRLSIANRLSARLDPLIEQIEELMFSEKEAL